MNAFLALAVFICAADGPTVGRVDVGPTVSGPPLKTPDLKGKYCFIVEIGITDKHCLAAFPKLNLLFEEYAEYDFVIVGLHRQEGFTDIALKARCEALGIRWTVVRTGSITNSSIDGIPGTAMFNPAGECLFNGHVRDCETPIRKAIAPLIVADIESPTKAMQPAVDGLKAGGTLLDAMRKLQPLKTSNDAATAEQAKLLTDKITAGSRKKLEAIQEQMKEDPLTAYEDALVLAARWKGFDLGTKAADIAFKLKSDKTVTAELKARPMLETLKKLDEALAKASKGEDPTTAAFKKKFASQLKEIKKIHDSMKRQYPEAKATKAAAEVMQKYEM